MTLPHKPFYYIRHGQTDWNKTGRMMGQTDIPLSDIGLAQAQRAVTYLKGIEFSSIVTSPLMRAKKTAEIIASARDMPLTVVGELKEACWGVKEGEPYGDGSWLDDWRNEEPIEGAELYSNFIHRVRQGLEKALNLPGPVLIVAHGALYWRVLEILGLPAQDLDNCVPVYHRPPARDGEPWFVCSLGEV